jgi:hypothetical protein
MESAIMASTFDVVSDFNRSGIQPAAGYPFTYGTETALNVGFTPFSYFVNTSTSGVTGEHTNDGTVDNWYFRDHSELGGPCVGVVATGGTLTFLPNDIPFVIPNDVLFMMPGSPGYNAPDLTVTRFIAPSDGLFDVAGSFTDLQMASVGLKILVNGETVFNSSFTGSSPYQGTISFSINGMSLSQGATIDFVVDSLGRQDSDVVGLKAHITENPLSPVMLNAVTANNLTTLSGTAEATSSVSVFDGTKLVGTVTAAADGTWSLQANVTGNVIHSFTETSTLGEDTASSAGVTLYTPAANKSLEGGGGNDVLIGRPNDTLTGSTGSDTFVFNPASGKNVITDFSVSQDVLRFDHTLFANATASQVLSQTHDSSIGAVIVVEANQHVTLAGVTVAQLQTSDFAFF